MTLPRQDMATWLEARFGTSWVGDFLWTSDGDCPHVRVGWRTCAGAELCHFTALRFPG